MPTQHFVATTTQTALSSMTYAGHQVIRNKSTSNSTLMFQIGGGSVRSLTPGNYYYWADASGNATEVVMWKVTGTVNGKFGTFGSADDAHDDGGGDE